MIIMGSHSSSTGTRWWPNDAQDSTCIFFPPVMPAVGKVDCRTTTGLEEVCSAFLYQVHGVGGFSWWERLGLYIDRSR